MLEVFVPFILVYITEDLTSHFPISKRDVLLTYYVYQSLTDNTCQL